MSFATPIAAALALLSLLVIVQYFLKLRRPPRTIPSTFLWQRALSDSRANAPWQRLRAEPLLLLQVLALLALVLALMRPFVLRAGAAGQNLVLVLDASLSTQATDAGGSRFDAIVARAHQLVNDLPDGNTISLIRMDAHPRVLIAASSDHAALNGVLSAQRPGYQQPDVYDSLNLAQGISGGVAGGVTRAEIEVLRSATTDLPLLSSGIHRQDIAFGNAGAADLAIVGIGAGREATGTLAAVIRIRNTGDSRLTSDVEVRADGRLEDDQQVSLGGHSEQTITSTGLPGTARTLEAHLTVADSLGADNTAWAVANPATIPRVLLATAGNLFLRTVLGADPDIQVLETTPRPFTSAQAAGADLVVLDGTLPNPLPSANLLIVNPPRSVLGIGLGQGRSVGNVSADDDPAGLTRYITPANIHVYGRIPTLTVPSWAHVALRDPGGPVLLEGEPHAGGIGRVAVVGFDLHNSDLPLSLDFPVFVANLLAWLAPGLNLERSTISPGDVLHIPVPLGADQVAIRSPDGVQHPLAGGPGSGVVAFAATDQPGIYTLSERVAGQRRMLNIADTPMVVSAGSRTRAANTPSAAGRAARNGQVPVELTGLVAILALVVLSGEWYVAMRRR